MRYTVLHLGGPPAAVVMFVVNVRGWSPRMVAALPSALLLGGLPGLR
jgi:hypothetical protein